ncbi:MAG: hypothetical protein R2845_02275 [Thermomicrobiales bacterium]
MIAIASRIPGNASRTSMMRMITVSKPAAEIGGDEPHGRADHESDADGDQADPQRNAGAVKSRG